MTRDGKRLSFRESYDVLVCGAGVAGVAAALECGRAGLRTALVEKTILPGGLATSGLVLIYLPLCDGNGTQVTFGIAEELLHLSLRYGPGKVPATWRQGRALPEPQRYRTPFAPAAFVLALDEILCAAGVKLWFDTLACAPRLRGDRVIGVEVANKDGYGLFSAACVVDATGDADIAQRAGAECATGDNKVSIWALQTDQDRTGDMWGCPDFPLRWVALDSELPPAAAPDDPNDLHGISARRVNRLVLEGRRLLREFYRQQQAARGPDGRQRIFPLALPTQAQFRTTRRIVGRSTLTDDLAGRTAPDSVGLVADWRKPGSVWEIPYGTLVPDRIRGLLAAGRCISSDGDAWQVTRVIPAAALTGQMAGLAATLAVKTGTTPDRLEVTRLQAELRQRGLPYHREHVYPPSAP